MQKFPGQGSEIKLSRILNPLSHQGTPQAGFDYSSNLAINRTLLSTEIWYLGVDVSCFLQNICFQGYGK